MSSADQNFQDNLVVGDMLLLNFNFEVRQCRHETFVVRTNSIPPRIAVTPSFILILCTFAECAQYAFKVMFIFEANMLVYERQAHGFSVARNRCCCHVASDLNTVPQDFTSAVEINCRKIPTLKNALAGEG